MRVKPTERSLKIIVALMAVLGVVCVAPSLACAEFSRPYITQLTGTATGPFPVGFTKNVVDSELGLAVAVDPAVGGNVYVGDSSYQSESLDVFSSANVFMEQVPGLCVRSLAFDDASGKLECSQEIGEPLAVDESGSEAQGDVYVGGNDEILSKTGEGRRTRGDVRRLTASRGPADFTCEENGKTPEYIVNRNELIGNTRETWGAWGEKVGPSARAVILGVAVDSGSGVYAGDIYVIYVNYALSIVEIDQFSPTGCFMRSFSEAGVPLKPFTSETGGTDQLYGIAVDPTDGDVVVPLEEKTPTGSYVNVLDEFTGAGEYLGRVTGTSKASPFGEHALSEQNQSGVAVSSAGDLYVSVCERYNPHPPPGSLSGYVGCEKAVVDDFGPGAFYPGVVSGGVSGARSGSVTLNGVVRGVADTVKGVDLQLTECKFKYVSEEAFQQSVKEGKGGFSSVEAREVGCAQGLVGQRLEEKNYAVSAEIKAGLVAGRTYRYRLVAATQGGVERGSVNEEAAVESFAAPSVPVVEGVSVSDVSSSWVDFHVTVDPTGTDTTYQVQYVPASLYDPSASDPYAGGGVVPGLPGDVGSGATGVSVNVQAGGLSAGTSYDYRVVASNGVGVSDTPNGVFSTAPGVVPGLADGRVYEMVTPPNKEDAKNLFGGRPNVQAEIRNEDATNYDLGYSSEDGEHFLLDTTAAFGSFPTSGEDSYVFSRGADGWSPKSSASPSLGVQSGFATVYDPVNFSLVGFQDEQLVVGVSSGTELKLVGPPGGPYTTIQSNERETLTGNGSSLGAHMVGASTDLSHVVLESADHELAAAPNKEKQDPGSESLYDWSAGEGLRLVNINPQGVLMKCGGVLGQDGSYGQPEGGTHNAVSGDGSRVIFTAPDPLPIGEGGPTGPGCWNGSSNPPEVYVRVNGGSTVQASAPNNGVKESSGNPAEPAVYVGASKDGSKVFFMTKTELTKEAVELGLHDMELYEYDSEAPEGERVGRVSTGEEGTTGHESGAGVQAVVALSDEGSVVYFLAGGKLTGNALNGSDIYRYETSTGKTEYVAPNPGYTSSIESGFKFTWYVGVAGLGQGYAGLSSYAPYYTTGNGDFLVFGSSGNVTGYDSGGNEELYRYTYEPESPAGGSVVCVSCDPTGAAASYSARFTRSALSDDNPGGNAPRPISENGDYVFFDTQESLLPAATNGKFDVYEWELEGTGECPHGSGGCLSLISTGQSSSDDYFLDSSPDGKSVFFGTHSKLVPEDTDEEGDLYDARIDGGFPAPIGAGPCEGDACDNPPPAPLDQTPASLSFTGPGDIATETPSAGVPKTKTVSKKTGKCRPGYMKKKGKCVKTAKSKAGKAGRSRAKRSSRERGGK
jgi:hypothetical protein